MFVDIGTVVVAAIVRMRVVSAVVGDPGQHRALKRHRSRRSQRIRHPRLGLEALVRKIAMKPDPRAHPDHEVADHKGHDLHPVNRVVVEPERTRQRTRHRNPDQEDVVNFLLPEGPPGQNPRGCRVNRETGPRNRHSLSSRCNRQPLVLSSHRTASYSTFRKISGDPLMRSHRIEIHYLPNPPSTQTPLPAAARGVPARDSQTVAPSRSYPSACRTGMASPERSLHPHPPQAAYCADGCG